MPWWGKSSSKEQKKKSNKEGFTGTINWKRRTTSEEKSNNRSGAFQRHFIDTVSEKGSRSRAPSRSPSQSKQVSRCQSFAERSLAQPLPVPAVHLKGIGRADSGLGASSKPGNERGSEPLLLFSLPKPGEISSKLDFADAEADFAASVSSDISTDSDDPPDSRFLSSQTSDYENGNRTTLSNPLRSNVQQGQSSTVTLKSPRESQRPANLLLSNQILSTSPKWRHPCGHMPNLQIPHPGAFFSAPDSSMSSPSRSPMRIYGPEQIINSGFWAGKPYSDVAALGSGHCSSPGSGHNSVGPDMLGQLSWQHSRCSPVRSPIPSPKMTSPGPSSRIHSGAVTPLHPQSCVGAMETSSSYPDDGRKQSHRLLFPPVTISNSCVFSPSYSTPATPTIPRSPSRMENPTSPVPRWKKGQQIGRGTFGDVYLGFNSESGEMCAMKEVTLFSDDAKSRESAQQLGQEIALLSRLRHPNIVQYYGSETVDDKLYIYLEYVSGGSIYKILQEYGPLGEIAIRSYTQQILKGLAYLHAKNTVHRDIKGANLLVDPSGRVKLADFGMAKHISGQACPLSFKGSPYWMAPEVIKNSNGCNSAVDIWSLGCTVIEMATTKPPWSQYEGVAAMFKIGNSKELPAIPDHLSEDGKDFIRQCLQRNPLHRPTASQLLEHPFVRNAGPLERPITSLEPTELQAIATDGARSPGVGRHARNNLCFNPEAADGHSPRVSKAGPLSSDMHVQQNISCLISPTGSPSLHPRSPHAMGKRMSPSPISSPRTTSGASTPLTGVSGASPFHYLNQPTSYLHESMGIVPKLLPDLHFNTCTSYQDLKPDLFCGMPQVSQGFQDMVSKNSHLVYQFGQPFFGETRELYDGQSVLAARVSQQLLRDDMKFNRSQDLEVGLQFEHSGVAFYGPLGLPLLCYYMLDVHFPSGGGELLYRRLGLYGILDFVEAGIALDAI
ncbi:Protein kinase domain [Dillenia turbinata]|uniref:mitogen-activated protein kinase kinase kinase n=1 Tax=Dillenia turbinata TaxID=194707 RepID=A0AAN8W876_9MAGN